MDDACLQQVLDEMNAATEAHVAAGTPMPEDELQGFTQAWAECGGANPYSASLEDSLLPGGRRLLDGAKPRCSSSPLSCYRNGVTEGGFICNLWCGWYSYCDARPGKWGKCKFAF